MLRRKLLLSTFSLSVLNNVFFVVVLNTLEIKTPYGHKYALCPRVSTCAPSFSSLLKLFFFGNFADGKQFVLPLFLRYHL